MKNKDNVRILDHEPTRKDFTQHELHLNAAGKTKVAKLMSQNVSLLSEIRKKHPITLKWNTTFNDPSTVNISKVMNQEFVVIGNEGRNEYQIDSINYGIKTSSLAVFFVICA
jgi:ferredoxin-fold anticodon binding domain-containing protein